MSAFRNIMRCLCAWPRAIPPCQSCTHYEPFDGQCGTCNRPSEINPVTGERGRIRNWANRERRYGACGMVGRFYSWDDDSDK